MGVDNAKAGQFRSRMNVRAGIWIACLAMLCAWTFGTAGSHASPQRVVSTFLCTDEYVFRLVPRDHIAALSFEAGDRHPVVSTIADEVGGIKGIRPDTETVLNLHPDLVVMYQNTMPRLHANLLALGVPLLDVPWDNSIPGIRRTTRLLGDRLGARAQAAALLAAMDTKLAAVRARAVRPAVRTLLYEPNGYSSVEGVTEELMRLAGLENAAPGYRPTREGTVPVEAVIAAAPELLIFSGREGRADSRALLVQHHPALATLAGRTYSAWADLLPLACPGPWSAAAAETFAELGHKARALAKPDPGN
jgi:iron complex transport system substrate-binding protein